MELETTIRVTTDKELKHSVMKEVMEITEGLNLDDMLAIDEYIMNRIDNQKILWYNVNVIKMNRSS